LWLDLQPVDIKSRWRHNWKSAQVVNSHLVCDPQSGNRVSTSLGNSGPLNRFCTEWGHCAACRRKWRLTDTDLCPCDETQTMSHIVDSCSLTKLNGGLSRLHSIRMKMLFRGWQVMFHDTHTRRRRRSAIQSNRNWYQRKAYMRLPISLPLYFYNYMPIFYSFRYITIY